MRKKREISAYVLRDAAAALFASCVIVAFSSAISLPNKRLKVPAPKNYTALGVNGSKSASSAAASAIRKDRTLTFADRVAYQRAIEEVYWRHRIWPAANGGPKPSLDKVMSHEAIEQKVEDYLRDSQALEDYWQRPITPDQLQAEMERIARHTKQPAVLRELFAALGDDPFVIAECLARPVLAERLLTELYAHDERFHGELKRRAEDELQAHRVVEQIKHTRGTYTEIEWIKSDSAKEDSAAADEKSVGALKMNSSEWQQSVQELAKDFGFGVRRRVAAFESAVMSAPSKDSAADDEYERLPVGKVSPLQEDDGHYYAVAVKKKGKDRLTLARIAWLKEPLRSWLAKAEAQVPVTMAAVTASYTLPVISGPSSGCLDDTWRPTAAPPDPRYSHTAVWTGSEMIVWGGTDGIFSFNTGAKYNPSTDSWTAISLTDAPAARTLHTAIWTGNEMIVWGGWDQNSFLLNTGGRYNPDSDTWTATSMANAPSSRRNHTAVWTGNEMIIWGGFDYTNTGGRYNPNTDSWTVTSTTNAPEARLNHTAVWTGSEMVVWGGTDHLTWFNSGGRYDPGTDSWQVTSTANAPSGRERQTAVWTGTEMIVWGGHDDTNDLDTGGRYNPELDSWTAISIGNAPAARESHTAVWTGSTMIVWGGATCVAPFNCQRLNTGGRYDPNTDIWTATSITNAPETRQNHTAVWTGSEMIVWGGADPLGRNTGGRYDPTTDSWVNTGFGNAPFRRAYHTAIWTGAEMIVWGGYAPDVQVDVNTGGRYDPSTDSWTATSTTSAPSARQSHTSVWTGSEMIVWGGCANFDCNQLLSTGGRYNPQTDSWTATSTTNAPTARESDTAVWTGTEMIVWGGFALGSDFNTGGRYDPNTNSWTATSTTNAPSARSFHTAVWSGNEMIVWGGYGDSYLNTGGRYDPGSDSWITISTTNAPDGRANHTAVWSGSEMIVWGGEAPATVLNSGGRYDPSTDNWVATSITNAPSPRHLHSAVWSGSQMIAWGGTDLGGAAFNTGGRYAVASDSWTATSANGAPDGRYGHTAVWTDREMIVWGGTTSSTITSTGGRYCAQSGPTPTPTPTVTASPTATFTPTPTPTPTPRVIPTSRPGPTSARRPTPPPRLTPPPSASPSVTPAPRPTAPPRLTPPPTPTGSPRPTPPPRP